MNHRKLRHYPDPSCVPVSGETADDFEPPLDPGIAEIVLTLRAAGVQTDESCQGGPGHAYPEPTVCFCGEQPEGFRALSVAMQHGLRVADLRRVWSVIDGEPTGPYWEMTFIPRDD